MRNLFFFIITLGFPFLHPNDAHAGRNPVKAPAPAWLVERSSPENSDPPASRDISYGYYISFYDEQVNVAQQSRYARIIKNIVNETGVQDNSEISISYASTYQQLIFHEIAIIRNGKKISKLNLDAIKVMDEEPGLSDYLIYGYSTAYLPLDDVRKGDKIEFAYTIKGFNSIYNGRYDDIISFYAATPVTHHYTSILMPAGRKLAVKAHNNAPEPSVSRSGNYTIYDWGDISLSPYETSGNPPAWYRGYPHVEVSEYTSWKQVASWASSVMNTVPVTLPPALSSMADKWYKEAGNDVGYAEKALRFVQDQVRYLGVELGVYTTKPHTPSQTFSNRYGDCKDKSLLLVALLRAKDIPCDMVLVNSILRSHIIEKMPMATAFDHVIVKMQVDGIDVYADPTISYQRGSLLQNYTPDYGYGLIVSDSTTHLTRIDFHNNGNTIINETIDVAYNGTPSTLKVSTVYYNRDADNIRNNFSYSSVKDLEKSYEEYYGKIYGKVKTAKELSIHDDTANNIITVEEEYTIDNIWDEENKNVTLYATAQSVYDVLASPGNADNEKPLYQPYPVNMKQTITLNMPDDWDISLEPYEAKTGNYYFSSRYTTNKNTITLEYEYTTYSDHIPDELADDYDAAYDEMASNLSIRLSKNKKIAALLTSAEQQGFTATTNWIAIFIALISAVGAFFAFRKINSTDIPGEIEMQENINGWLILLAIVLCIRPPLYLYTIFTSGYFGLETWLAMNELGNTAMQLFLILELVILVAMLVWNGWLIYWFFNKRNIFPRMFVIMAFTQVGVHLVYILIGFVLKDAFAAFYPDIITDSLKDLFKAILFAAIWATAVLTSAKSRRVFTRAYATGTVETTQYQDEYIPPVQ